LGGRAALLVDRALLSARLAIFVDVIEGLETVLWALSDKTGLSRAVALLSIW
jgi:hypothetical protein